MNLSRKGSKKRAKIILDTETGEFTELTDYVLVHKNSMKSYKKIQEKRIENQVKRQEELGQKYNVWNTEYFYKGNIKEIRENMSSLNIYERAFIYSVAPYVGYDDCCLRYDNGKELRFNTLLEISGISKGKLSETINSLISKNVLYRDKGKKETRYFLNPRLFIKGNRVDKTLMEKFKENGGDNNGK